MRLWRAAGSGGMIRRTFWVLSTLLVAVAYLTTTSPSGASENPGSNTVSAWCGSEHNGTKIEFTGDGPQSFTVPAPPDGTTGPCWS